ARRNETSPSTADRLTYPPDRQSLSRRASGDRPVRGAGNGAWVEDDLGGQRMCGCARDHGYSTFESVICIAGSQLTPSSDRSWRQVCVLPSSLNTEIARVVSPCHVQTPSLRMSCSVVRWPAL